MNRKKFEKGQALVFIVFAMVGLLGLTGLAVDGGRIFVDRQNTQNATDAAVLAAALARVNGADEMQSVVNSALGNGYDNNGVTNYIKVDSPPTTGAFACTASQGQDAADNFDSDHDGVLNEFDDDLDNDGKKNHEDDDMDGDGIKNEFDDDNNNDGVHDDHDKDGDGIDDDHSEKNDHYTEGVGWEHDNDHDGIPDGEDDDDDNDGKKDNVDNDRDGDGLDNEHDDDNNNDGIKDRDDHNDDDHDGIDNAHDGHGGHDDTHDDSNTPKYDGEHHEHANENEGGEGEGHDDEKKYDNDHDGVKDGKEHDSDNDGKSDKEDDDLDNDGKKNHEDDDMDGDGIKNEFDDDNNNDGTPDDASGSDAAIILCDPSYIQVTITSVMQPYFASIVGVKALTNKVVAIAHVNPAASVPLFDGNAVVALKPTGNSIYINGDADWTVRGGSVFANANFNGKCNKDFTLDSGQAVIAHGSVNCDYSGTTEVDGAAQIPYPTNFNDTSNPIVAMMPKPACDGTLNGGYVVPTNPSSFTFSNGLYCVSNFDVFDKKDIVLNNAVLYVTDPSFNLKFAGGGGFKGSGPASGPYGGLYMVVALANPGNQEIEWRGNGSTGITGTILAPSVIFDYRGNSIGAANHSQLIAYQVQTLGTADINIQYNIGENRFENTAPTLELAQ